METEALSAGPCQIGLSGGARICSQMFGHWSLRHRTVAPLPVTLQSVRTENIKTWSAAAVIAYISRTFVSLLTLEAR